MMTWKQKFDASWEIFIRDKDVHVVQKLIKRETVPTRLADLQRRLEFNKRRIGIRRDELEREIQREANKQCEN